MRVKNAIEFSFTPRQQQLKERRWDYDLVSLAADARVTGDGNLVGLQVPRTCEAASWEPNEVYLHEASFSYRKQLPWLTVPDLAPKNRSDGTVMALPPTPPPSSDSLNTALTSLSALHAASASLRSGFAHALLADRPASRWVPPPSSRTRPVLGGARPLPLPRPTVPSSPWLMESLLASTGLASVDAAPTGESPSSSSSEDEEPGSAWDAEALLEQAAFFDSFAERPDALEYWRKFVPGSVYRSLNDSFYSYLAAQPDGPWLPAAHEAPAPRRHPRANLTLLGGAPPYWEGGGSGTEWANVVSYPSKDSQPHCRWFVNDVT